MTEKEDIMVSVYCLAYNHEKYIKDALEGFVMQKTNFKFEVIVHDDASTDGTADIIREYEKKYPDIIKPIYQTENQYSKKIKIASTYIFPKLRGKYVAVCEGDDYWNDENKLQIQVDILEEHKDYSACVHQTIRYDCRDGSKTNCSNISEDKVIKPESLIMGITGNYQTSSLMYRKEYLFNRPEFYSIAKGYGDYPLAIYLALRGKVYYINRTMSLYRAFSCRTSFTYRTAKDDKKWIAHCENVIDMLRAANEYSKYKYDETFNKTVSKYQYNIEKTKKKKFLWLKKDYRCFYFNDKYIDACILLKNLLPNRGYDVLKHIKRRVVK